MNSDWVSSLGFDLANGTLTLPVWAAGVIAVLFVIVLMVAILRTSLSDLTGAILRLGVLVIAVLAVWVWFDRTADSRRAEERRVLDSRAAALAARTIEPGSPLACLDAAVGENVEGACERIVFASAESVASAVAYVEARMLLLNEGHEFAARRDPSYDTVLLSLRRAIEADRFGLAAQVLASRDGCTAEKCDFFDRVVDSARLRANLKERTYETLVTRHAASWPARPRAPAALSSMPPSSGQGSPVPPGFTLPSAASIPPVSIMNAEPAAPPAPPAAPPTAGAAAQEPPAAAGAPARRPSPRPQQARSKDAPPAPPVQLVPPR